MKKKYCYFLLISQSHEQLTVIMFAERKNI